MSEEMSSNTSAESADTSVESQVNESEINELEASVSESTEQAPAPKSFRVKVDGQEIEVTEEELLSGYQSTKSAQQRFNEAARMRKQAEEFIKIAKTDPKKLLTHPNIGIDLKAFANDILAEMLEEEMLSPQEKELRSTKKKLAEYEEAKRKEEEARKQSEMEKYTQLYEQEYTEGIVSALETSGLPKSESTVKKMASYMLLALENGLDVKPKDVVEFVKRDYINEVKSLFGSAEYDTIVSMLGDDISNKVVKGHLNKVKKTQPQTNRITEPTKPAIVDKKSEKSQRTMTRDEWLKMIADRAKGK